MVLVWVVDTAIAISIVDLIAIPHIYPVSVCISVQYDVGFIEHRIGVQYPIDILIGNAVTAPAHFIDEYGIRVSRGGGGRFTAAFSYCDSSVARDCDLSTVGIKVVNQ